MAISKNPPRSTRAMLLAALSATLHTTANAYIIESASFGQTGKIAPEGNLKHWVVSGHQYSPEILSDKVILTPPYPGHKQGAMWTQRPLDQQEWLVDFEFRATGPDNGQGALQLWYTKEHEEQIQHRDLYGAGKFTGLALLLDPDGGRPAGGIRAFLNDGTFEYRAGQSIGHLPFAHCSYAYRNRGLFSKLQLRQDAHGLELLVDGQHCFKADGVFLPRDHYFGVTANSGARPDSFEVSKFIVQTSNAVTREEPFRAQGMGSNPHQGQQGQQQQQQQQQQAQGQGQTQQAMADQVVLGDIRHQVTGIQSGVSDMQQRLINIESRYATLEEVRLLEAKMDRIQSLVEKVAAETRDWSGHFEEINRELRSGTNMFLDKIPQHVGDAVLRHGPSVMQLLFVVIAAQLMLGLAYILYRRRQTSPKKYL